MVKQTQFYLAGRGFFPVNLSLGLVCVISNMSLSSLHKNGLALLKYWLVFSVNGYYHGIVSERGGKGQRLQKGYGGVYYGSHDDDLIFL